jgi:PAS domain S-box-containing protein
MSARAPFDVHPSLAPILNTVLDAVVVMTSEGRVVGWNGTAEQVFGWSSAEATDQLLVDLIVPPQHRAAHQAGLSRLASGGEARVLNRLIEISALCRDGKEIPIELSITTAPSGLHTVFVGFIRDITQRRAAEARTAQQALEARLMFEIAQLAAESDSFEEALQKTLEAICEITGWPVGHAFVIPPGSPDALVSTNIWVESEPGLSGELRHATETIVFVPGDGLPGQILQSGAPLWLSDADTDEKFLRKGNGFLGVFGFPLKHDGSIIAILEFFSKSALPPEQGLLLTVRALGEQVGRVFERKRTQDHEKLLRHEQAHRIKNILAVVQGIAQQTFGKATSVDEAYGIFCGRLMAVAHAQDMLISQHVEGATLHEIIEGVVRGSGIADNRISAAGPDIRISPRNAMTISLGIHELCTNALKYGALSVDDGLVSVAWGTAVVAGARHFEFEWRESGGPPVIAPHRKGFGSRLLEHGLAGQLGGKIELTYAPSGVVCHFTAPLPARRR